ncbi:MAG: helix-turn-helix domain-containing protein [Hyphomonas sp.]|nr:helix-turn-helix domain-containing protein [Hyphomonas sp.]
MQNFIAAPSVDTFDIASSRRSGNFDAWRGQVALNFDCTPLGPPKLDETSSTTSWRVNTWVFSEAEYSAMASARRRSHLNDTGHVVFLYRFLEGANWLQINDTALRQSPGSLLFLDYAHEFSAVHTRARTQGVFIPHEALGLRPGDLKGFKQIRAGTALARFLIQELDSVFATLKAGHLTIQRKKIDRLAGCLQFAVGSTETELSQRAYHREAQLDLIRQFIEVNLEAPELNTSLVLKNFGVSRAGLFRMFEKYGGVRSYINERRLVRAALDLAQAPTRRGSVTETADRWGFSSDANFVRAIKARFGTTPGALFQSPIVPAAFGGTESELLQAKATLQTGQKMQQFA